jgi:processive 1,2-diacylglycerol beta-glucosyltransferase
VHLAICVGRNKEAENHIKRLSTRCKRTSLTVIPFTNKISDLMYVADVFITKPGGQTCAEAIAMGLPMLLDRTRTWLFMERKNIDWLKPNNLGTYFKSYSELPELVKSHLGTRDRSLSLKNPPHDALRSLVLSLLPVKH